MQSNDDNRSCDKSAFESNIYLDILASLQLEFGLHHSPLHTHLKYH